MFSKKILREIINAVPRGSIRRFSSGSDTYERSLNSVQLIGRAGNDPQKRGSNANPVVVFSLATTITYDSGLKSNSPGLSQIVDWHRISVFKPKLSETVYNYLKKGQRVFVSGRISYGEVTDDSGKKTVLTSIIADDVIFFNSKQPIS